MGLATAGPLAYKSLRSAPASQSGAMRRSTGSAAAKQEHTGRSLPDCDRQSMLLLHLPQVRLVAKSIWDRMRFAVELDDLIGYGIIGLVNAVERFDPSRGILLKTYAEHRIRGAILDGLRGMDWLPRSARQRERRLHREACDAAPAGGGPGKESPEPHGMPYVPRMESVVSAGNLSDLEKLAEFSRQNRTVSGKQTNPENAYEEKERYEQLADAMLRLPRRHREVIELYYRRELSMKQIGERLQVHESRISQLHAAAIQRLRKQLKEPDAYSPAARSCAAPQPWPVPEAESSRRTTA